ncbi:hypothetical protein BaRGS_00030003 [Batillaria attramentaria]|uniref:Uncharacterized protein n=1 Tax=Batillaria attramentaria TaxID=370345 RepID=A0ABD0JUQ7_9CAEN
MTRKDSPAVRRLTPPLSRVTGDGSCKLFKMAERSAFLESYLSSRAGGDTRRGQNPARKGNKSVNQALYLACPPCKRVEVGLVISGRNEEIRMPRLDNSCNSTIRGM